MPKTVQAITNGMKLRATPKEGALTLRLGTKKYTLPFEARMIASSEYVFIHIPSAAAIMKIGASELKEVATADEAEAARKSFRPARKKAAPKKRASRAAEMPAELAEALKKLPAGYKLAYGADGKPKMVRTRNRSKKA